MSIIAGIAAMALVMPALGKPEQILPLPTFTPESIAPDVPTFVTATVDLRREPPLRRPKLQVFDPTKSKWVKVKKFKDNGRREDPLNQDRVYTLRFYVLDENGMTAVHGIRRNRSRLKASVPTPAKFRVATRRKDTLRRIVSSEFELASLAASPVEFGGTSGDVLPRISVPKSVEVVDASDPYRVRLIKSGPNGYGVVIITHPNDGGLELEHWIISCFLLHRDPCTGLEPTDATTLEEYSPNSRYRAVSSAPLSVDGLSGFILKISEPEDRVYNVFIEDPAYRRVIEFHIYRSDPVKQDIFFDDNLSEALSIVESLRMR